MPRRNTKASTPASRPETPGERVRVAATRLFARKGFAGSSMRDLARAAEMSLAGLYHHFASKDELLFELQRDAYERLMQPLAEIPADAKSAERLKLFVQNHLRFFAADITAMKVLSRELEALDGELNDRMRRMRRKYYSHCRGIVTDLLHDCCRPDLNPRVATMTLFGMINWIYTWYKPATDGPPDELASQMVGIFLHGVDRRATDVAPDARSRRTAKKEDGQ